ncbi:MAG: cupin domain-containing protein [Candidatus Sumerlaeia bacterium]|nr:cupin domain-containing protein [Candidatus Sumerlaeia bacterium]
MSEIRVKKPRISELQQLGVTSWPIWEHEPDTFNWEYDQKETCYFLEGDVTVTTNDGKSVHIEAGDLVEFPQGLKCTWKITQKVTKHYKLG